MKRVVTMMAITAWSGTAFAGPSAEELYDQGETAFERHDWPTAIAKWQRAYDVSGVAGMLYNLAQAWRLSGDCGRALPIYKRFIQLDPTSERRELADGFVAELSAQCGLPAPQINKRSRTDDNMKLGGLITGGAGVAVLATGLAFGWRADSLGDEVTADCVTTCDWSVERTKQRDGRSDESIGKVLDMVGVGAIAVGVGLYIYGATRESSVTVQPHDDGAAVSWSGRW